MWPCARILFCHSLRLKQTGYSSQSFTNKRPERTLIGTQINGPDLCRSKGTLDPFGFVKCVSASLKLILVSRNALLAVLLAFEMSASFLSYPRGVFLHSGERFRTWKYVSSQTHGRRFFIIRNKAHVMKGAPESVVQGWNHIEFRSVDCGELYKQSTPSANHSFKKRFGYKRTQLYFIPSPTAIATSLFFSLSSTRPLCPS